jgi:hypothetical protein
MFTKAMVFITLLTSLFSTALLAQTTRCTPTFGKTVCTDSQTTVGCTTKFGKTTCR